MIDQNTSNFQISEEEKAEMKKHGGPLKVEPLIPRGLRDAVDEDRYED